MIFQSVFCNFCQLTNKSRVIYTNSGHDFFLQQSSESRPVAIVPLRRLMTAAATAAADRLPCNHNHMSHPSSQYLGCINIRCDISRVVLPTQSVQVMSVLFMFLVEVNEALTALEKVK